MNQEQKARMMSKELAGHVSRLLLAQAAAEIVRESIDKLDAKILAENDFGWNTFDGKIDPSTEYSTPFCRDAKLAYLMDDESAERYNELRKAAIADSIWFVEDPEFCPALVAENKVIDLERELLVKSAELMDCPQLAHVYGDKRKDALRLATDLVVSYPGFKGPSRKEINDMISQMKKGAA